MKILADASLPGLNEAFPDPFIISTYESHDEILKLLFNQDILLCRSTLKVNRGLFKNHQLQFLATASSGTDHIDHDFLDSQSIQLIDAKGSNAASVADYVMACLAWLEKNFMLFGKKVGIIGMGYAGTSVFKRLQEKGLEICTYDPLKADFQSCTLEELFQCDVLCIHAELHHRYPHATYHFIDEAFLAQLKPTCILINAARGGIVKEEALLKCAKPLVYCTDVYENEPCMNKEIIQRATLCTPHIAGHSLEAKFAAVAFVSERLHRILGLPIPRFATPDRIFSLAISDALSWQNQILSIYNPEDETLVLKQAQDMKTAFFELRKRHQKRHDFSVYF